MGSLSPWLRTTWPGYDNSGRHQPSQDQPYSHSRGQRAHIHRTRLPRQRQPSVTSTRLQPKSCLPVSSGRDGVPASGDQPVPRHAGYSTGTATGNGSGYRPSRRRPSCQRHAGHRPRRVGGSIPSRAVGWCARAPRGVSGHNDARPTCLPVAPGTKAPTRVRDHRNRLDHLGVRIRQSHPTAAVDTGCRGPGGAPKSPALYRRQWLRRRVTGTPLALPAGTRKPRPRRGSGSNRAACPHP
jgi:hypothetical protein